MGAAFTLDNAGLKTEVHFDMDLTVMHDVGKKIENNLKKAMEYSFEHIVKQYRGYPSALHKTKEITVRVEEDLHGSTATVRPMDQFAEKIYIRIDYEKAHLASEYQFLASFLTHELLHIVSRIHEGQEEFIAHIRNYEAKDLKHFLHLEGQIVNDIVRTTQHFGDEVFLNNAVTGKVPTVHVIQREFDDFVRNFWNWISDVALDLIAIKLQIWEMMNAYSSFSKHQVGSNTPKVLVSEKHFHNAEKTILSEPNSPQKEKKLNLIYMWEWMLMVSIYPFHAMAYARSSNPYDDSALNSKFHHVHNNAVEAIKEYESLIGHTTNRNKPLLHKFDSLMKNIADMHYTMGVNPDFHATQKIIHHERSISVAKQALALAYGTYKEYAQKALS